MSRLRVYALSMQERHQPSAVLLCVCVCEGDARLAALRTIMEYTKQAGQAFGVAACVCVAMPCASWQISP